MLLDNPYSFLGAPFAKQLTIQIKMLQGLFRLQVYYSYYLMTII